MRRPRLLRITTVPQSLSLLLKGQFAFMSRNGFEVWTCSADGKEVERVRSEGVEHRSIPFTRRITPFADIVALFRLIRLIRELKPDIVHTHTPKAGLLGMMAARFCGVPIRLHTVAGLPLMERHGLTRLMLKWTERLTYSCAHRVYPNSSGLMAFIRDYITPISSKFRIIGKGSSNGIDAKFFARTEELEQQALKLRSNLGILPGALVYLFVGRLVRDKGIVELVDAFEQLPVQNGWLVLVGPDEPDLDPLPDRVISRLKLNPHILLPGFQSDVRPWLAASDVFVFPSYREGFPNAVMQAACLGIPCIVSDINGNNEIIRHAESGLIVPPRDTTALKDAMHQLTLDPARRRLLGEQSRLFVTQHFGQDKVWEELLKEYNTLLVTNKVNLEDS